MDGRLPALGKIAPEAFERLIAPHLGARRPDVLVGPRLGHDCAIVRIGAGRVMALTTDPLSMIPCLGLERPARLACHLLASDLWTGGIPPAFAALDFDLPAALDGAAFERYWRAMSDEWDALGGGCDRAPGATGAATATILGGGTLVGSATRAATTGDGAARRPPDRHEGLRDQTTAVAAHRCRTVRAPARRRRHGSRPRVEQVSVVADCRTICASACASGA